MYTTEQLKGLSKKELMALIKQIPEGQSSFPQFGTWISEKSGTKFMTIKFQAYGKGIMLSVDQWNTLIDNADDIAEYMESNDID